MKKNLLSILLFCNLVVFAVFLCSYTFEKKSAEPPSLYIVEYSKGANWDPKKDFGQQKFARSHSNYLQKLRGEGIIHFGARYAEKGIIFIAAMSLDNAKSIIGADSAVSGKLFSATVEELTVFYEYRDGKVASRRDAAGKVTGIGGIFFKAKDVKTTNKWYYDNLGLTPNDYGSMFEWRRSDDKSIAYTQWSTFSAKTKYFQPSKKDFMINYRVDNLEMIFKKLKANNVILCDTIESYDYGKFLHIMDCDSNKIELWEPVDASFTKLYEGKTTK